MKKTLIFMASLMVLVSGTVTTSSAEDIAGRSGLGIGLGYISPKDDVIDSGTIPSINYTYGINSNFAVELSLGRAVLDVDVLGEFTIIPLQLTAQYRIPSGTASPYLGAGVGYYFNSDIEDSLPGVSWKVENDDSFGYHVNAGVDIFLNKNIAFNLDARYFWAETDTTAKITSGGVTTEMSDTQDLDSSIIGAGIKYLF